MMNYAAYIVWAVTALIALWRIIADRDDGRVTNQKLLEKYGKECCGMLQDSVFRGLAASPSTHSSGSQEKNPSQSQAERASQNLAKKPSPRPGNASTRK